MSKRTPIRMPEPSGSPGLWRSLEEKKDPRRRHDAAADEPGVQLGSLLPSKALVDRRSFMKVTGATAAAVGFAGCIRRPAENILPYTQGPEYTIPGVPLHYATSVEHQGEAIGLLVESHEGRPTKIEGNQGHPSSLGATDALIQGRIHDLYDPERSAHARQGDDEKTWGEFDAWWREKAGEFARDGGRGLRVLMPPTLSPSMIRARDALVERFPQATVHTHSAVSYENIRAGAGLAFGMPYAVQVELSTARTILALDSDVLASEPGFIRSARGFADGRRVRGTQDPMNRLYVVEGSLTVTGMNADHRLRLAPSQVDGYLRALATKLATMPGVQLPPATAAAVRGATIEGVPQAWIDGVAADLVENRGRSVVCVGWRQPPHVHALAHAVNAALGNAGNTVAYHDPIDASPAHGVGDLIEAMSGGSVETLLILGGNPAYDAPGFAAALGSVDTSIHLSSHVDETSSACTWHLPMAHELESWGDHRASSGAYSIQQPLIAPLRGGRSPQEILAMAGGIRGWRGYHLVRKTLRDHGVPGDFEALWRRSLHLGIVDEIRGAGSRTAVIQDSQVQAALSQNEPGAADGWEVIFASSYQVFDGSQANNPWLLELPDPVTKLVWDNAAYLSPASARDLDVSNGDMLQVSTDNGEINVPAFVVPGQADRVVTLPLGFGRTMAGSHGNDVGVDVTPLRGTGVSGFATGASVTPASGESHTLVSTQEHHSMTPHVEAFGRNMDAVILGDEGFGERQIVAYADLEEYRERPNFPQWNEPMPALSPLWTQVDYSTPRPPAQGGTSYQVLPDPRTPRPGAPPRYKWALIIDLTTCTGCSACIIACQAENNVAVVGKRQVQLGREMHWMRLDRYFIGDDINEPSQVAVQPVGCQQCEEAPCENVCPVNATSHTAEGLNDMAYNRCIGTRYCMNNCPYKVRRFNFLDWHGDIHQLTRMQHNPNVTVRMRGVMEKCSYCVQRIQYARIQARIATTVDEEGEIRESRIEEGLVTPACAQACPSAAIVFGDLNDEDSAAHAARHQQRQYSLLGPVGAQPRTTYLAKLRNPNPEMV